LAVDGSLTGNTIFYVFLIRGISMLMSVFFGTNRQGQMYCRTVAINTMDLCQSYYIFISDRPMQNICCELNSLMRNLEQIASRAMNFLATNGNEGIQPTSEGIR
jgi:hypothetical protein